MEDDFQFVDVASSEPTGTINKDIKLLREEVQRLTETWSSEHNEVKTLQKQLVDCRVTTTKMNEELKQMKEERHKMREKLKSLQIKNDELSLQTTTLREDLSKMNHSPKTPKTTTTTTTKTTTIATATQTATATTISAISNANLLPSAYDEPEVHGSVENDKKMLAPSNESTNVTSNLKELDLTQCYGCKNCNTHIALENEIINRCHQVGQGSFTEQKRGFLFSNAYNLTFGVTKTEKFTTGSYDISPVCCCHCGVSLGWKYLTSSNENNKFKVGKFCLARYSLTSPKDRGDQ